MAAGGTIEVVGGRRLFNLWRERTELLLLFVHGHGRLGHYPQIERPDLLAAALDEALGRVPRDPNR